MKKTTLRGVTFTTVLVGWMVNNVAYIANYFYDKIVANKSSAIFIFQALLIISIPLVIEGISKLIIVIRVIKNGLGKYISKHSTTC